MLSREKDIRPELYGIWNRKLYQWWRYYDEEYLGKALREPLIVLNEAEEELGHWDASYGRLSISVRHIERHPWLEVMETLRHEMAHQYVDEVLQPRGEEPHGAAFQQACKKLRCSPRARGGKESSTSPGADERILRLIKKLLSLSSSPNENEAQAAVTVAVPVDPDVHTELVYEASHKGDHRSRAGRSRVTAGVTDTHAFCAGFERSGVESADLVRMRAGRVFCHEHRRQTLCDAELDRLPGEAEHLIEVPALCVLADGR